MHAKPLFTLAALVALAAAKTDLEGCTSSETVAFGGASMIFWDPDTGEICSFLDCGGGRAPPKTTVPGCPQYEGTATYTPEYMPGWGADATPTPSAGASVSEEAPVTTEKPASTATKSQSEGEGETTTGTDQFFLTGVPSISIHISTGTPAPSGAPGNGTATFSSGNPSQPTGGAAGMALGAAGHGVLGLAGVVAGLAML
jgi:hypothetical protein